MARVFDMKCPDDKTDLLVHASEDRSGWKCAVCSGVWLPKSFVEALEDDYPKLLESFQVPAEFSAWEAVRRRCPEGHGELQPVESQGLELDWCVRCNGYWFDEGELTKIHAAKRGNGSSLFVWQDILFFFSPGSEGC